MTAMLLATRCPNCKTTFKVANDQLKLQSGLVRCGICNQVFNGIEHLAPSSNVTASTSTIKINAPTAMTTAAPAATQDAQTPAPQIEESKPAPVARKELEFDLFDEFKIAPPTAPAPAVRQAVPPPLPQPVPKAAQPGAPQIATTTPKTEPRIDPEQTAKPAALPASRPMPNPATVTETRIEPNLDIKPAEDAKAESRMDETFFPRFSEDFSLKQSKTEIEAKIQALLDQDLKPHSDGTSEIMFPEDGEIEEIIVERAQELDQTLVPKKPADLRSLLPGSSETGDDVEHEEDEGYEDEIAQLTFVRQANRRKLVTWLLSIATLLLFIALLGQTLYQFRDYLAAAYPASKDTLVTLCRIAHCQVNFPATPDAISYEADELHTLARDNTYEFGLLMRNHSALTQAWPSIELTLKDSKKEVVLKRVFGPSEYLANPHDELSGFGANQEQPVKLYFVVDKIQASDYVVTIFYP